ncbi:hypothetical protein BDZ94DRAFT_1261372 [Collybia nuda]|uniref:Uncharacterized protein n=1 Tax=Collybia nuda TaxID=64659 RepID=A0A9P6CE38_9AGAR|nr:hypothetical protein BDZ94DRAFT_1261372 [Collybia nuda]
MWHVGRGMSLPKYSLGSTDKDVAEIIEVLCDLVIFTNHPFPSCSNPSNRFNSSAHLVGLVPTK